MEQTVYIDLYFLINFSMDLLCFFLTSRLLSHRFSVPRVLAASGLGGVYACASLFIGLGGALGILLDLLACALMSAAAVLKKGTFRQAVGYTVVYAAVSTVLGGFMTALFSLFNRIGLSALMKGENDGDSMSVWLFALLAAISGVASLLGGRFFRKKSSRRQGKVKIIVGEKSVLLTAMCDSGNLLREPISNKACIVVDKDAAASLFSRKIDKISGKEAERIRVIPTRTVNGEGMLYALRADSVSLNMGKGWCEVDAFVAFGEIKNGENGVRALIPSELAFGTP